MTVRVWPSARRPSRAAFSVVLPLSLQEAARERIRGSSTIGPVAPGLCWASWSSFPSSRHSTDAVTMGVIMVDDFSSDAFARDELLARRLVGCTILGSTAPVGVVSSSSRR